MPNTAKGIWYPGSTFQPNLVFDIEELAGTIDYDLDGQFSQYRSGPDTLVGNTTYQVPGAADSVNVLLPNNECLVSVYFVGQWKKTAAGTVNASIFIDANQLKVPINNGAPTVQEVVDASAFSAPGFYGVIFTDRNGLSGTSGVASDSTFTATQGMIIPGVTIIYGLSSGFHNIQVKYKSPAGVNLAIQNRTLIATVMNTQ